MSIAWYNGAWFWHQYFLESLKWKNAQLKAMFGVICILYVYNLIYIIDSKLGPLGLRVCFCKSVCSVPAWDTLRSSQPQTKIKKNQKINEWMVFRLSEVLHYSSYTNDTVNRFIISVYNWCKC